MHISKKIKINSHDAAEDAYVAEITSKPFNKKIKVIVSVVIFALVASLPILVYQSFAATRNSPVIEPDTAALSGGAQKVTDATASEGYAVKFSATTPPTWTPRFPGDPKPGTMYYGSSNEGGNPATFETQLGNKLALFRSYFNSADSATKFVTRAKDDINNNRVPLMSTKVPNNDWVGMANGTYDAWLTERVKALAAVPGPVWLSLHHEPRSDGNPADWAKMQQHARKIIDANSTNIALVGILNGYDFKVKNGNPGAYNHPVGTGVHVMGFDSYNPWFPGGNQDWKEVSYVFSPGQTIVTSWGYPTLVGEYGVRYDASNPGKAAQWLRDAYTFGLTNKFVAISYFNSGANSPDGPWTLDGERLQVFKENLAKTTTARAK